MSLEDELRGTVQCVDKHIDRHTQGQADSFESNYKSVQWPSHTERCRRSIPTWLLPSQHGGEDAGTLAQVGVCFSQLVEEDKRETDSFHLHISFICDHNTTLWTKMKTIF